MAKKVSLLFFFTGVLFTTSLLLSNILATKILILWKWEASAGILVFPITYILNDVITEVWGFKKARFIIWTAFGMNVLMLLFFTLAIHLPPASYWPHQEAFAQILGSTPRVVLASLTAYLTGSFINAYVMAKMKLASKGKNFSARAVVSTLFGEGADSMFFVLIAFSGKIPVGALLKMILVQATLKTLYEVLVLPLTIIIVKKVKQAESQTPLVVTH